MPSRYHHLLPTLAVLAATVIWSSSFIALKYAIGEFGPMPVVFGRMLIATLLFLPFWRRLKPTAYHKGDWKLILLMTLFEPCLYFLLEGYALSYTSAAQAGIIVAILPLVAAFAAWVLLGERVGMTAIVGFVLAIGGVAWLTLAGESTEQAPYPLLGNTLEALAMIVAAGYVVAMRFLTRRYSAWFLTAVQATVGSIFFAPVGIVMVDVPTSFDGLLWPVLAVVYLGTVVTIGAYGLFNVGISSLPAAKASAYLNLGPLVTLGLSWLAFRDVLTPAQVAGALLVVFGVYLSQRKSGAASKSTAEVGTA